MNPKKQLKICLGSSCFARGNKAILQAIKGYIATHDLQEKIDFRGNHCFGRCMEGPNLSIDGRFYPGITPENIEDILRENLADL